ncbi:MAG: ammonia channel protein [Verrucomicrobia bacterium]|nr:MAG: ammonia channel protein [Verrucomicrobiota bacterium]
MKKTVLYLTLAACLGSSPLATRAEDATPPKPSVEDRLADLEAYVTNGSRQTNAPTALANSSGPGHNAWQMTSSALVLFMTLPGLALFYGGLVRRKNVLSVLAQCLGITGLVTILWCVCGYSLTFHSGKPWVGGLGWSFLNGVDSTPNTDYGGWVSHNVFAMYQLMFAIITPALIVGAIAERMKFAAILAFMTLWMFVVYFPLAHMIWGVDGLMNGVWNASAKIKAIDFAGGTVVHMSSGWSALVLCLILGKRLGFGKQNMAPHNLVLCMVGTGMLWVGWYGFNAGSAVAADGIAANAFTTTTLATAIASFVWPMAEWLLKGKPSVLGFCSGAVAGLVVITPACGFVTPAGALVIGIAAGIVPFFFCYKVKAWFGYDDALDTFGVHAVGGTLGAFLTGALARTSANPNLANFLKDKVTGRLFQPLIFEQLKAIALTLLLAVIGTTVIAFAVKAVMGLRPVEDVELAGLDVSEHGEEGYHDGYAGGRAGVEAGVPAGEPILAPAKSPKPAMT